MKLSWLPTINATLNTMSTVLIVAVFVLIKTRRREAHRNAMLGAVVCSILFLASYLYYHWHVGTTPFGGTGLARTVYFTILISHTILAAAVPFLVIATLVPALRERFDRHKKIAVWTLPIWLYVSITGVVVYVMLYHLFPST